MTHIEYLKNMLVEVEDAISFAHGVLKSSPEGYLRVKHNGKTIKYFQRLGGQTDGRYLGRDCIKTILQLEEKAYCSEIAKVAEKEKSDLEKALKLLESLPDYRSVYLSIPPEKRHLIGPYEYRPKTEESEDLIRVFNRKPVSDRYRFITQNGEHVRSKSEVIIADRLKAAGIRYFYEDPLILADEKTVESYYFHPDFRVQNPRTGKLYYWEHFGKLDDRDYCASCQNRLEAYAKFGYFPGENLIITTESSEHSLNLEYVDCLISRYLK